LGEGESAVGPVAGDAHAKDPLAVPKVVHFELGLDGFFEETNLGTNDDQVVYVYIHAAEAGGILMDEEAGVNFCRDEVDGEEG
jgi:hypothetical protein